MMSQKSILSFFKSSESSTSKKETNTKVVVVADSPVKKRRNKRKVQCLESDDESSDVTSKNINGKSSETTDVSAKELQESADKCCDEVKNAESKINGNCSPRKPAKQIKPENNEETNSSPSPSKVKSPDANHNHALHEGNDASINSSCQAEAASSCSNENSSVDFIPKRKTARKQMSSGKSTKRNIAQVKEELEQKTDSLVKSESPNKIVNSEEAIVNSDFKQTEDPAPEKVENNEKNLENDKLHDTVKEPFDVKQKKNTSRKDKSSPVKKSAKKESIHSFFTPIKKTEDKVNTEEYCKKSAQMEIDDSPIKQPQNRKKKVQCIESDEENDESVSKEETVKKEIDDIEMKDVPSPPKKTEIESKDVPSPPKKTEIESKSPEKSVSKENKTSPGKSNFEKLKNDTSKSENSKNDHEKQKFAMKSTSATDTIYNPAKTNYHPIEDAFWKQNEKVPYLALAKTLELIENTSGRLKTIEILSNYFRSVIVLSPEDLLHSVYLCLNRVAPEYEGIEMGVGETLLMKAVAQATGRSLEKIKAEVAVKGDLGLVSESSRGNQRVMFAPPKLTVSAVFNRFLDIAKMSGNSAMAKKTDKIKGLFIACRDCEAKYIIRSLSGKLRIGLAEQSILSAIARAAVVTPPGQTYPPKKIDASKGMSPEKFKELLDSQILILKTAYCECPNYDLIIPVLLKDGISALPDRCQLSPGVPLKPMLAHPTAGIDKVLERFDKNAFTCEFKYDGERAQIHMNDNKEVKIFSRNQEDNTSKYPDVISRLKNALKESTKSFILDSETVAWDRQTKQILPFQVLSTRKRKDAVESEIVVQVCIMAFDLLYLNGESLVKKPLKERRSLLHSSFNEVADQFMFAQYKDGNSAEIMQEFLDESVKGNCEGLMVKALEVDASYEIAKRSHNWLKLKKDYLQGVGDTLDLVVIGGYFGKGKRTGNYGGFLLACYDEENEEFQSICKLGTGFKDDILEAHTKFLKQHVIKEPKSYFRYDSSLQPDEWFEPVQVWEIKCADLSISPVHKAAMGIIDPEKGISLRFPRFIRIRDDKSPENATNSVQIADMYQQQQQIQNTSNKNSKTEEDYY